MDLLQNKSGKYLLMALAVMIIMTGVVTKDYIAVRAADNDSLDTLTAGVTKIIEVSYNTTAENSEASPNNTLENEPAGQASEWDSKVMANVNEAMNIRLEPSTESTVVGKLYKGGSAEILEAGPEWTKISSGDVTGYANNEYLAFGDQAKAIAEEEGNLTATVTTETLRVREGMSLDSPVLGLVSVGEKLEAVEVKDNWAVIAITADKVGYVSCDYVSIELELGKAETIEEIQAREEARKKAEAEAAAKKAAETAKVNNGAVAATGNDALLLGALVQCEAGGESYEGKLGVAAAVMNRVRSQAYPNSVYEVIYASGQFTPAGSGKVASLVNAGVRADCLQAAQEAINGSSNIGSATHFRNVRSGRQGIAIGNHVFW